MRPPSAQPLLPLKLAYQNINWKHACPHPTPGGRHIPDKTAAGLVMGVKDGFCFWPGMWRGPEELARTIVPGMKGKEGKRGGGDHWEKETKQTPGEPQLGDIFLSPGD